MDLLTVSLSGVAGLVIGILAMVAYSKAGLNKDQQKAEQLLKKAETEAEAKVKQAVLDGKTQAHDLRVEAEKEIKERKQEAMDLENKFNFQNQSAGVGTGCSVQAVDGRSADLTGGVETD